MSNDGYSFLDWLQDFVRGRNARLLVFLMLVFLITLGGTIFLLIHSMKWDALKDVVGPCVLGSASIVLTLSARNASLSTIMRNLCAEIRQYSSSQAVTKSIARRAVTIESQLTMFRERFQWNQLGLLLQFIAIPLFIGAYLLGSRAGITPDDSNQTTDLGNAVVSTWAVSVLAIGFSILALGAIATIIDFWKSLRTIQLEYDDAVDVSHGLAKVREAQPEPSIHALVYLQRMYHDIAYKLRFEMRWTPKTGQPNKV